jgi:hypothetical protein
MNMFMHPHGRSPEASITILTTLAKKVHMAVQIPMSPILPAITSSFFCKRVGSEAVYVFIVMTPANVSVPTAKTTALPIPVLIMDLASIKLVVPEV